MYQALPLDMKISLTKRRICDWVNWWGTSGVYVSFSGGKDSTVLLHMVRQLYPDIEAVFVNTGLEYPEIQQFVKSFDNVTILRPKMRFDEVIKQYGYPIIGKEIAQAIHEVRKQARKSKIDVQQTKRYRRDFDPESEKNKKYPAFSKEKYKLLLYTTFEISHKCCGVMKKNPAKEYEKKTGRKPILATMASESRLRETKWLQKGCNAFDDERPRSAPMSFWTEQDVLQYIKKYNIPIAKVYGEIVEETQIKNDGASVVVQTQLFETGAQLVTTGCDRTGCIFCAFGAHLDKESRFERLKQTHPRPYEYCIGGGEYDENGVWKPNKQGLGMGHVFDELNKIYGDGFIKY
jgi:3'-phosphoadenosine 5'-phosphosulfate sulfotransferase (PAPS reductase)/FAD synthetase